MPRPCARSCASWGCATSRDAVPGITRRRAGKGFGYRGPDGRPLRDAATLAWIRSLAIPPAWTEVWISPFRNGHLLATGRDAKGRKQYRYHPRWRTLRDETKFGRMLAFGRALPRIRAAVAAELARPGLGRRKVLATVVRLLETTLIRVGNDEYARANKTFGLTTMRNRHVKAEGAELRFRFKGKAGKAHAVTLRSRRLANLVQRMQALPGQELFQYQDEDGRPRPIDSGEVNEYLREIAGDDFTAKDFRTWSATVLAAWALSEFESVRQRRPPPSATSPRRSSGSRAGSATRRRSAARATSIPRSWAPISTARCSRACGPRSRPSCATSSSGLEPEEVAVLIFLQQRLAQAHETADAA